MQLRVITMQSEVLKYWKDIDDVVYYNVKSMFCKTLLSAMQWSVSFMMMSSQIISESQKLQN